MHDQKDWHTDGRGLHGSSNLTNNSLTHDGLLGHMITE